MCALLQLETQARVLARAVARGQANDEAQAQIQARVKAQAQVEAQAQAQARTEVQVEAGAECTIHPEAEAEAGVSLSESCCGHAECQNKRSVMEDVSGDFRLARLGQDAPPAKVYLVCVPPLTTHCEIH